MRLLHNFPRIRRPATWDKIDDPTVLLEKEFVRPPVGRILWTRKLEDILLQDKLENMSNVGNDSASVGKTNYSLSENVDDLKVVGRSGSLAPMWATTRKQKGLIQKISQIEPTSNHT